MCVVSMIGEHYADKWTRPQGASTIPVIAWNFGTISREEFDELKKEVMELKELLTKAAKYDEETGQPDCHMDEKVAILRKIAEAVGVDLSDIFK